MHMNTHFDYCVLILDTHLALYNTTNHFRYVSLQIQLESFIDQLFSFVILDIPEHIDKLLDSI